MSLKIFIGFLLISLISGCSTIRQKSSHFDYAENAINRQDWEVAYRFLEDYFIASGTENEKSFALIDKYPQILVAGAGTFTTENIRRTLSKHGEERGLELERQRLEMYKIVASSVAYRSAKANFDEVASDIEAKSSAQRTLREQKLRHEQELQAEGELKRKNRLLALVEAKSKARYSCQSEFDCKKAFSLTQIFVSENSDMKIQVATETIIETYNPTETRKIGLKAIKIPRKGETSEIVFTVVCRDDGGLAVRDFCVERSLEIYRGFPVYLQNQYRK